MKMTIAKVEVAIAKRISKVEVAVAKTVVRIFAPTILKNNKEYGMDIVGMEIQDNRVRYYAKKDPNKKIESIIDSE